MAISKIEDFIPLEIYKLNNVIMRVAQNKLDMLKEERGLTQDNFSCINGWVLWYLYNHRDRDVVQKDLEEEFSITRSTASKIVRLMEKKGLVESGSVDGDARLKKLERTEKSKEYRGLMRKEMDFLDQMMLKDFSPEEKNQLMGYLKRMRDNMRT